ncbi:hypothetical protein C2845_PM05G37640 [Panicum miliaceum]|uniref:Uncharacterized protein n=1 Tax=Panicum miliaceum TaxID=4540 RepID=A0A3L6T501_PANMI|nr:hypothetical protein C2845_PM05G37640 [Panicum miliaceum]
MPESSESEVREEYAGDDASSLSGSSSEELIADNLSFGSLSSVEHSEGYWERQMEANQASLRAFILSDADRESFASWVRDMPVDDSEKTLPPFRIVKYPELMDKAWAWERLVPYDCFVDMATYANYLKIYYEHNSLDYIVTGDQKPEECPLKNDAAPGGQICNWKGPGCCGRNCK